jgi:hypothetical protein
VDWNPKVGLAASPVQRWREREMEPPVFFELSMMELLGKLCTITRTIIHLVLFGLVNILILPPMIFMFLFHPTI